MGTMETVIAGFLVAAFAGLLGFFFSIVSQRKYFANEIKKAVDNALKNHLRINHKHDMETLIDNKIKTYSKEVDYKFEQSDEDIDELKKTTSDVIQKNIHSLTLAMTYVVTKLDGDPRKFNL